MNKETKDMRWTHPDSATSIADELQALGIRADRGNCVVTLSAQQAHDAARWLGSIEQAEVDEEELRDLNAQVDSLEDRVIELNSENMALEKDLAAAKKEIASLTRAPA